MSPRSLKWLIWFSTNTEEQWWGEHVSAKACFMWYSEDTQDLEPHDRQPKSKKISLNSHIIFLWKGTAFSGCSPPEHHHIPSGTTGWDSALFSDDYPVLPDIYMCDNRNVKVCFSFNCPMLPLSFKNAAQRPSLSSFSRPSTKTPPLVSAVSVILHFSLIPLTLPPLLPNKHGFLTLLNISYHRLWISTSTAGLAPLRPGRTE